MDILVGRQIKTSTFPAERDMNPPLTGRSILILDVLPESRTDPGRSESREMYEYSVSADSFAPHGGCGIEFFRDDAANLSTLQVLPCSISSIFFLCFCDSAVVAVLLRKYAGVVQGKLTI